MGSKVKSLGGQRAFCWKTACSFLVSYVLPNVCNSFDPGEGRLSGLTCTTYLEDSWSFACKMRFPFVVMHSLRRTANRRFCQPDNRAS